MAPGKRTRTQGLPARGRIGTLSTTSPEAAAKVTAATGADVHGAGVDHAPELATEGVRARARDGDTIAVADPATVHDPSTMAHEAIHLVQQHRPGPGPTGRGQLEDEAERGASAALSGRAFAVHGAAAGSGPLDQDDDATTADDSQAGPSLADYRAYYDAMCMKLDADLQVATGQLDIELARRTARIDTSTRTGEHLYRWIYTIHYARPLTKLETEHDARLAELAELREVHELEYIASGAAVIPAQLDELTAAATGTDFDLADRHEFDTEAYKDSLREAGLEVAEPSDDSADPGDDSADEGLDLEGDLALAKEIVEWEDQAALVAFLTGESTDRPEFDERLAELIKDRFKAMRKAFEGYAGKHGLELVSFEATSTDGSPGFRDLSRQGELFFHNKFFDPGWLKGKGTPLDTITLEQRLLKVLEFSAFPGMSRHHWRTDVDIVGNFTDETRDSSDLDNARYRKGGDLYDLSKWLEKHAASFGFVRPYTTASDRGVTDDADGFAHGGHQLEMWHYSYLPIALALQRMYEVRSDQLMPQVANQVMTYLETNKAYVTEQIDTEDGAVDPFVTPHSITAASLLSAMQEVGLMEYVSHVNQVAPE